VGWNLLLLNVYRHGGGGQGGDPAAVCAMVARDVRFQPMLALGMLSMAGWLTYTLVAAFRYDRDHAANLVPEQAPYRLAA
jgi:hypothetical protein